MSININFVADKMLKWKGDLVKPGQGIVNCIPLGIVPTSTFIISETRHCRLVNAFNCITPFFVDKLYRLIGDMPGYIGGKSLFFRACMQ
jgi:hypothetical protein